MRDTVGPKRSKATTRRRLLLGVLALVGVRALPAPALAAAKAAHDVENSVSPDTMCGFTRTSHWTIRVTGVRTGNGSTISAGQLVQTFLANAGRGVKISYDAGVFIEGPTTFYSDGSSSFSAVANGLDAKTQALGGRRLGQSTGRVFVTAYFDPNGDFVSLSVDSTTGPQNNTTGEPDCSVIGPYLAGQ